MDSILRSLYRPAGYLAWLMLLILSIRFYRERAFFMDAGFQLFNLINEKQIQIYHYRFVTALPQLIPYLFLKFGAPLKAIALSFSASYILFYTIVYHFLSTRLDSTVLGWCLIFLFTLISFDTFYHIQSEFYLGLSLMLPAFAMMLKYPFFSGKWKSSGRHWFWWLILLILLITIAFSHKLTLVFFVFLWLFFLKDNPDRLNIRYLAFLLIFILLAGIKMAFFTNWYEAAKEVEFKENLRQYADRLWAIPAHGVFLRRCLHHYYWYPVFLMLNTFFYLKKRAWFKLVLLLGFSLGYILLYHISDPEARYRFYSEVNYLPVALLVSIPFFFDVFPACQQFLLKKSHEIKLPALKWLLRHLLFICISALILSRCIIIGGNHRTFRTAFDWIEENSLPGKNTPPSNRYIMVSNETITKKVLMDWGTPFTSMHLSALHHPEHARTLLIVPDLSWYHAKLNEDNVFLSPFHKAIPADSLNQHYYRLAKGKYILKTYWKE